MDGTQHKYRVWSSIAKQFKGENAARVIAVLSAIFLVLGVLVRYSFLQSWDLAFSQEVQEHQPALIVNVMKGATFMGNSSTIALLAIVAALASLSRGLKNAAILLILTLTSLPVDYLLKLIWQRARPDDELVNVAVRTSGTSFPSGHAFGSTMFYGAVTALCYIHLPKGTLRNISIVVLIVLIFAIDASRVYLGAHWLSDVVGGSCIGLALLIPAIRWYSHQRSESPTTITTS